MQVPGFKTGSGKTISRKPVFKKPPGETIMDSLEREEARKGKVWNDGALS